MNGIINLLKPPGMTSNDAVVWLRKLCGTKKCGHGGTLDPAACGVLPVLVGNATKLFDLMLMHEKQYTATVRFGLTTDTLDAEGQVTAQDDRYPDPAKWEEALAAYTGVIRQIPPLYSAIRIGGVHAYKLARKGVQAQVPEREVNILSLETLSWRDERTVTIRIVCSSGTYIRTLISDLAGECGCYAYLAQLTRERSGMFDIRDAVTVEELLRASEEGRIADLAVPLDQVLADYPVLTVKEAERTHAVNGAPLDRNAFMEEYEDDRMYRIKTGENELISLSKTGGDGRIRPQIMLFSGSIQARKTEGGKR